MSKRWFTAMALLGALALASPLLADRGDKKDKGNPHGKRAFVEDRGRHDRDDDRWERRGGYEYRVYEVRDARPPGWSHGNKTGWGNCGLPPGQAKKYGCRTYVHEGRRYYFYQDEHGRVIMRRPTIQVHVDIAR